MRGRRIPPLWGAIVLLAGTYLLLKFAFPPVMPRSVLIQYMVIIGIGMLLYYSADEERWREFLAPLARLLRDKALQPLLLAFLIGLPTIAAYATWNALGQRVEEPPELRQAHPAPPRDFTAYGKKFDLTNVENPIREEVLELLEDDAEEAMALYQSTIGLGSKVYYENCFYCHGDLLDGQGILAEGLRPRPANFRDVGTIAQLQEAYLFWRIATGGPGLPREGTPWNSAMPVWADILNEEEIWSVIAFLYDHVGQVPRMWNEEVSRAVSSMNEEVQNQRSAMDGQGLYQFHCAVCHGDDGAGDGVAADFLYPKPRDFTLGMFKYKTSPFTTFPPTDDDIFHTIKDGLPGTGMPAWQSILNDDEIRELIAIVKGFDLVGTWAPEDAPDEHFDEEGRYLETPLTVVEQMPTENAIPFTAESVAIGREQFDQTCSQCHGVDGRGNPFADKRLKDEWGNRIWPRDLTKPWTWRVTEVADNPEETIRNIFTRISVGIPSTPMPAHAKQVPEEERWHIANFVYTLRDYSVPLSESQLIRAARIEGELPENVDDALWESATPMTLSMLPNVIKGDRLFKPLTDALTVRALYNDDEFAIRLEQDDRTHSRPGDAEAERTQDRSLGLFSDAFAVQFPKADSFSLRPTVEKPLTRHGDRKHPTTIWYWNAGSVEPTVPAQSVIMDAEGDNRPLVRQTADGGLQTSANWINGRWRVSFRRPRNPEDTRELAFMTGAFLPISFANWNGSNGEVGSRHTLSSWYWLSLEEPANRLQLYSYPPLVWLALIALGLGLVRHVRRRRVD